LSASRKGPLLDGHSGCNLSSVGQKSEKMTETETEAQLQAAFAVRSQFDLGQFLPIRPRLRQCVVEKAAAVFVQLLAYRARQKDTQTDTKTDGRRGALTQVGGFPRAKAAERLAQRDLLSCLRVADLLLFCCSPASCHWARQTRGCLLSSRCFQSDGGRTEAPTGRLNSGQFLAKLAASELSSPTKTSRHFIHQSTGTFGKLAHLSTWPCARLRLCINSAN